MADLAGAFKTRLYKGAVVAVCKDALSQAQIEEIRVAVRARRDHVRRGFLQADPRDTGRVSKSSFRKVLYFAGKISYATVHAECNTVPAPSGFVDYPAWMGLYIAGDPETPRVQAGIDDNARPEADVVREVRQMVLDNYEDVMEAFNSADTESTGELDFAEFTRCVFLGLRMTRMTIHHRAAIFHHAKTVGDTNNVDYIDWLKLFAASYVHSRGKKEPAPDSPDFQTPVKAELQDAEQTVTELVQQLRCLDPAKVAEYVEGLNLSPQTRRDIEMELAKEGASDQSLNTGSIVSPTTGDKLIREVLSAPITAQQKLHVISELPIDPARKSEVSAELEAEL